ncbi:MAG: hypothetical protein K8T20_01955 [Planctomycetes bacterium]|nr:hypothetical protein [Planctomycetota bacterium]
MKRYRITACISAALFLAIAVPYAFGYGIYFRYLWIPLLAGLLFLAAAVYSICSLKKKPQIRAADLAVVVAFVVTGVFGGSAFRSWRCRSVCDACEPVIAALEDCRKRQGNYPTTLADVDAAVREAREKHGVRVQMGRDPRRGIAPDELDDAEATLYADHDELICVVPVTKMFPMSFTRIELLIWSSTDSSWKEDHIIWYIGGIK